MANLDADDRALTVALVDGDVVVLGQRVAIALTPRAAAESARRISAAARTARQADRGRGRDQAWQT